MVLRRLIANQGHLNSVEAEKLLNVSRPTARTWMRELSVTGIVEWVESDGNSPERINLGEKWSWMLRRSGDCRMKSNDANSDGHYQSQAESR